MALQKAIKTYPMVKWFLVVSGILIVLGLLMSKLITDPDNGEPMTLVWFVVGAVLLPFLALAFPRREVLTLELPTDSLGGRSRSELEGILSQLDAAKAKGEMDEGRYTKARAKILAAMKGKPKA
ncbi:MAG: hypothetical protein AABY18_03240 [Candidatus Thermoplasmatota archaeon]